MLDPYDVLGVERNAGMEDIKRVYRKVVRECHPDVNPGVAAERRFKEVSLAYGILSDEKRRAMYDEFGAESLEQGFDPFVARERRTWNRQVNQQSPFGDLSAFHTAFGSLFGDDDAAPGAASNSAPASYDETVGATIDALVAILGGVTTVDTVAGNGRTERVRLRVRAGVQTGEVVTLQGMAGHHGRGAAGDLHVRLTVREHPLLRRLGDDVEMDVPITLMEAIHGGAVVVPTPTGPTRIQLPPNCAGARLRLHGRGVQRPDQPGNLILVMRVVLPDQIDAEGLAGCEAVERCYEGDPRDRLRL